MATDTLPAHGVAAHFEDAAELGLGRHRDGFGCAQMKYMAMKASCQEVNRGRAVQGRGGCSVIEGTSLIYIGVICASRGIRRQLSPSFPHFHPQSQALPSQKMPSDLNLWPQGWMPLDASGLEAESQTQHLPLHLSAKKTITRS